ncbi:GNAT family N-acetyltransferase [Paenibacillus thermotolerans]|uniref:GNAT family N-acetyltransferase n=1 Tax=Paenibacillus thermotolerans TaxID=3027807 RepID=UPI002368D3D7|nr:MULTISPECIES: GNAT family N-acetyltransferase [unclassified Paenibacillus]
MIELKRDEYFKIEPLLAHKEHKFIFVFVHSIIDHNQPGKIFVNNKNRPTAGLVTSRGGKYYVFGDEQDQTFHRSLFDFLANSDQHANFYDLYFSSNTWLYMIKTALNDNVVELSRTHYILGDTTTSADLPAPHFSEFQLTSMNDRLYERYVNEIDGSYSLLWDCSRTYLEKAFGYCFINNSDFVSACNTFYVGGGYIEPDIITLPDYRMQGLAFMLCQEFIKHSRQQNLIPYWDCDSGNTASNLLAVKLGFHKVGEVPILWWHENKQVISNYLIKNNYKKL